ncbi:hypothetical protein [Enterococcus wangshanyuanii]|uniref:HTH merR-type domain-containing protein n=1 Tax=Enterococcus wangshanyuanii TaxID=2005703 RepID=A0ABQ1PD08_9ENTE|nr:hypothetical protein [Enterococcus wangshanyuanii]GGC94828.1 hypothetical protein GCM10011573_25580 [Enterococcus wangshanyuanii]
MDYFTIPEVCEQLSVKERTIRSWINKIEERTEFRFTRKINMSNPRYLYGNPVPQLMLDEDEVKLLEKLADNRRQGANLSEMIDRLFLLPEDYNQRYPVDKRG